MFVLFVMCGLEYLLTSIYVVVSEEEEEDSA